MLRAPGHLSRIPLPLRLSRAPRAPFPRQPPPPGPLTPGHTRVPGSPWFRPVLRSRGPLLPRTGRGGQVLSYLSPPASTPPSMSAAPASSSHPLCSHLHLPNGCFSDVQALIQQPPSPTPQIPQVSWGPSPQPRPGLCLPLHSNSCP